MKKSDIYWQTYINLEKEVIEMSKYIFITDEKIINRNGLEVVETCSTQLLTFSPHIADLLVRCCVQIEAISKELYFDLNGEKQRGDNTIKFDEDCLKLIDIKWETHNKRVLVVAPFFNLTKDENRVLRPLKEAHKRQGTYWEKAYQAVKHDRYACLCVGNVKALIQALAALYLLNVYYRRETWIIKYQDLGKQDYSLGSALFSVLKPVVNQLWEGNNPQKSESPFVVSYQDDVYKQIDDIRRKEFDNLNNYWRQQPELQEPAFLAQLQEAFKRGERVMQIWELAKYRLNKSIPPTLPFDVRKERLIKSEAWNCWINQHNQHLAPEELTEENIQDEINEVGVRWGMEIMKRYQRLEWVHIATNSGLCRVYIP
jgi:hypothetical protein